VVGIVERNSRKRIGRVVARVAPDIKKQTLRKLAKEFVLEKGTIFTDEYLGYDGLQHCGYAHKRIRHTAKIYVTGDIHTNTIEGFWSLVKRGIGGVYDNVSAKYLQTYLNEYSFRYNRRDMGNLLFRAILERVSQRAS
jgi:transposase